MSTGAPDYFKSILLYGLSEADEPLSAYITDDGRFVFRIEDWPDIWGEAAQVGLAEVLAVTTGAKRFDRRGQTIFYDSFESGLVRFITSGSGAGWSVSVSGDYARFGGHSCHLVTGSDASHNAYIRGHLPLFAYTKMGIEVSFSSDSYVDQLEISFNTYGANGPATYGIRLDIANLKIYYYDSTPAWTELDDLPLLKQSEYIFNTVKLVFDRASRKYIRLLLNNNSWDMSALSAWSSTGADAEYCMFYITATGETGQNADCYLDDVIITQNEPE